jgi:hypothetical protein
LQAVGRLAHERGIIDFSYEVQGSQPVSQAFWVKVVEWGGGLGRFGPGVCRVVPYPFYFRFVEGIDEDSGVIAGKVESLVIVSQAIAADKGNCGQVRGFPET